MGSLSNLLLHAYILCEEGQGYDHFGSRLLGWVKGTSNGSRGGGKCCSNGMLRKGLLGIRLLYKTGTGFQITKGMVWLGECVCEGWAVSGFMLCIELDAWL
jgi:hypothetical protein